MFSQLLPQIIVSIFTNSKLDCHVFQYNVLVPNNKLIS
jgi:hypothetical protein